MRSDVVAYAAGRIFCSVITFPIINASSLPMQKKLIFLLSLALTLVACGGSDDTDGPNDPGERTVTNSNRNDSRANAAYARLEYPHLKGGSNNIVIIHQASFGVNYSVEWDTDLHPTGWDGEGTLRAQRWSCFRWHNKNSNKSATSRKPRDNSGLPFAEYPNDADLAPQYHFTDDPYWNSGYDHGHVMASADRGYNYNARANEQTFYMTNMQPQVNGFNGGVWVNMEGRLREWNTSNFRDTLYVCKGGTIDHKNNILRTIGSGRNKIPVPKYFFMAVLCKNKDNVNGGYKALGFWVEHKVNYDTDLSKYVVNIDELERLTGIDFFCNLPDNIENAVESLPRENVIKAWKP